MHEQTKLSGNILRTSWRDASSTAFVACGKFLLIYSATLHEVMKRLPSFLVSYAAQSNIREYFLFNFSDLSIVYSSERQVKEAGRWRYFQQST
jgi:hypothetical protein